MKHLCLTCRHAVWYQPMHFLTPGKCGWTPPEPVPYWVQFWLEGDDPYYGPKRAIAGDRGGAYSVPDCAAYDEKD